MGKEILYSLINNEKLVLLFSRIQFYISWSFDSNPERKALLKRIQPNTLVSYKRLVHLWKMVNKIETEQVAGNFVECGVWKGGAAAIMVYLTQKINSGRKVHLFDSYQGMPEPSLVDGERAAAFSKQKITGKLRPIKKTVGTLQEVKTLFFSKLKLKRRDIYFHKGWFQTTVPLIKNQIGKIAILRIDADWYESVKICLDELYDQVVAGGHIVFDDYGFWPGCRKAVNDFFREKKIKPQLQQIDFSGAYFQKPL